jgi:hypothetical protein
MRELGLPMTVKAITDDYKGLIAVWSSMRQIQLMSHGSICR